MFNGIKEKLGFGGDKKDDEYFDDYDSYDEYGSGDYNIADSDSSAPSYRDGSARDKFFKPYGATGRHSVKAADYIVSTAQSDSVHGMKNESYSFSERGYSSSEGSRSAGLNSLFSPTSQVADIAAPAFLDNRKDASYSTPSQYFDAAPHSPSTSMPSASSSGTAISSSFANTEQFGNFGPAADIAPMQVPGDVSAPGTSLASSPMRLLKVLDIVSYEECSQIAPVIKDGNVAVLTLRIANPNILKRVLDFAFGVASALDAKVDALDDKVYVIAVGEGISSSEMASLRSRGVI